MFLAKICTAASWTEHFHVNVAVLRQIRPPSGLLDDTTQAGWRHVVFCLSVLFCFFLHLNTWPQLALYWHWVELSPKVEERKNKTSK